MKNRKNISIVLVLSIAVSFFFGVVHPMELRSSKRKPGPDYISPTKRRKTEEVTIQKLPHEMLTHILEFVASGNSQEGQGVIDLLRASRVCRLFYGVGEHVITSIKITDRMLGQHFNNLLAFLGRRRIKHIDLSWVSVTDQQLADIIDKTRQALETINLSFCSNLQRVNLENIPNLHVLNISKCSGLRNLAVINLANLRVLKLSFCKRIEEIEDGGLPNLEALYLIGIGEWPGADDLAGIFEDYPHLKRAHLSRSMQQYNFDRQYPNIQFTYVGR